MDAVRGRYFLMINSMLNEFNPELAEKARNALTVDIKDVQTDGWYDRKQFNKYIAQVSPEAQRVLGKKMLDAADGFDKIVSAFKEPVELIKFAIKNDPKEDVQYDHPYETQILDSGPDFITIKLLTDGFSAFMEGVYLGMLERYRIVKKHVKTTSEMIDGYEISTMEIKWG